MNLHIPHMGEAPTDFKAPAAITADRHDSFTPLTPD